LFQSDRIPTIIYNGFSDKNDEKHARAMGVIGFLMKPFAAGELVEMVTKILKWSKGSTFDHVILL
jgi:response regulator RpfG family c-di-GMP phosphodiesterase